MLTYITSDTHCRQMPGFNDKDFDLILHCGDFSHRGHLDPRPEIKDYYKKLQTKMFWVPGNHDVLWDEYPPFVGNIHKKVVNHRGLLFLGLTLSCCYPNPEIANHWDHMTADKDYEIKYYSDLPYADVVISHSPPTGCGEMDKCDQSGLHLGSEEFRKYIERVQPKIVFCGHIHKKSPYVHMIGRTEIYNVATTYKIINL